MVFVTFVTLVVDDVATWMEEVHTVYMGTLFYKHFHPPMSMYDIDLLVASHKLRSADPPGVSLGTKW